MKKLTLLSIISKAIIVGFILSSNNLVAQLSFESHTIVGGELAAFGASSVFAADLDGDGDMDVISASRNDNKIAWYEQDELGNFSTHVISISLEDACYVHAADLDGDGDSDIISSGQGIIFYENDGNGSFTPMNIGFIQGYGCAITAEDMDGDGDLDIVNAGLNYDGNGIVWFENSDEWIWPTHVVDSLSYTGWVAIDAGDMDGDGDIDIVAAEPASWDGSGEMSLFENTGNDLFIKHQINGGSSGVYLEDIDGDDDLDIVSQNGGSNYPFWYENTGNNEFSPHQLSSELYGCSMGAEDMDNDGDMDILSTTYSNYNGPVDLSWFENDGSNNFTSYHIVGNDIPNLRSVFACDINLDGDMDVVVAKNIDVSLFENDGEQDFTIIELTKSAFEATNAVFGDMNGDGVMDIVSMYANTIAWYENDGNQQFTTHVVTGSAYGGYGNTLSAADMDGDNDVDIVYGFYAGVICYKNNGTGNFSKHTIITYSGMLENMYIDDLDQDEDLDVLVSFSSSFNWYENDGEGSFSQQIIQNIGSGIHIRGICTADLENDGDKDILVAKSGDFLAIYGYKNDGNQNFIQIAIHPLVYGDADAVNARDFDLDGDMDFIYATNTTQILYSRVSDYSFTSKTLSETNNFSSFYTQDIDMDGDDDIMVTDYGSNKLFYLENMGENMFSEFTITGNVKGAMSVCAGDINGDDDMDLLTASFNDSKIAWYENLIIGLGEGEFKIQNSKFKINSYPNPFYEIVHIEFEIVNPSLVSIQVFNAIGEKVTDLQDGILPKGKHLFSWNAQGLPAGLYFCRVQVGGEVAVVKALKH